MAFLASNFSENLKFFIFCGYSYQDYAQTSVCMFTVTMETPIHKVKMPIFIIFNVLLPSSKLLIKISILHHARTNSKLLLYVLLI